MSVWWIGFLCDLIIPLISVLAGFVMYKHPPKRINSVYGYRTNMSMKNMDTWQFAHQYSGKLMVRLGVKMTLSALVLVLFYNAADLVIEIASAVISIIQVVGLVAPVILTEKELKKHFDENGARKTRK